MIFLNTLLDKGNENMNYIEILHTNDLQKLKEYLQTHDVNEEVQGGSLLYWAVYMNNTEFAELLINKGADINKIDIHGRTPLSTSCFFNFEDITSLLLENAAIIDVTCVERGYSGWNGQVQNETLNLLRKYGWVNLYLDDLRDIPEGFMGVRSIEEALDVFEDYNVHILSLDHDLGTNEKGELKKTGYDLVKYLCANVRRTANKIYLHTDNVVGRDNMYQTLLGAQRRGFIDADIEVYPYPFVKNRYSWKED
ncbi:cyclic-phosphate processing receiver domain-containing protein [Virgibacillus halodenitrificans]|uniref:cyclic-phosphate processing receiver domain-containing protein n=1 Tax=Virgibacillus halodenitrificans TaxID=1482 RepID=UPI002DD43A20|nr:cyclic-phosphate processing receiver domain-containing protein [Virgibacillus halodenitrificans]